MYEKTIKYLEERAMRSEEMRGGGKKSQRDNARGDRNVSSRNRSGMDGRNPYGSRGGYVRDRASDNRGGGRDNARGGSRDRAGRNNNMNNDYRRNDRRMREDYADYDEDEKEDFAYNDYADYDYASSEELEQQYKDDLKQWTKKLMKKDKFKLPKQEVIKKAEEMNIEFEDFSEEEFIAVYLMHVAKYPNVADNPHTYIVMAKQYLEDDNVNVEPSENVCKYLYEIVLNEE